MTKSANNNIMTSLHLIRLMLEPGWPACMEKDNNAEFDFSVFLHAGICVL